MSRGAIGPAANRLIEHGFFDKRRDGRTFSYRLQIPAIALTEGAESYLEFDYAPGTFGYEHNRPLGEIVLKLFPRT